MRKVSLESEINVIIRKSVVTCNYESFDLKACSNRKHFYEFDSRMEEELRKRARNMFKKKPERYPVPKSQDVLAVFSKYRGMVDSIVKAVERCTRGKELLPQDVLKKYLYKQELNPIMDLGIEFKDAKTLFLNAREIPYALQTMPKAYF